MKRYCALLGLTLSLSVNAWSAKYKIKEIEPLAAADYKAHQNFQNIVIGARPYATEAEVEEIFDARKLHEKGFLPVLVVVENNNDFAIEMHGSQIFLLLEDGSNVPPIPINDVLLGISLDKPPTAYSTRKEILLRQAVKPEMYMDFEHKAFAEKLIAPHSSDYGVIFFPLPGDDISKCRLYFPEVVDLSNDETLMFFEFPLQPEGSR